MKTPTYELAAVLLRQDPVEWLREQRSTGLSWRRCAGKLRDKTKGKLDVSDETLRNWVTRAEASDPEDAVPAR